MPLTSPRAVLLAKWLAVDLNSLRDLNKTSPDEAIELIGRVQDFINRIQANAPKETQP